MRSVHLRIQPALDEASRPLSNGSKRSRRPRDHVPSIPLIPSTAPWSGSRAPVSPRSPRSPRLLLGQGFELLDLVDFLVDLRIQTALDDASVEQIEQIEEIVYLEPPDSYHF